MIAASAVLLSVAGFAGVADAYPVPTPPTTAVAVAGPTTPTTVPTPTTAGARLLPRTGGDIDNSLALGASVVALGAGLVLVTRRRLRSSKA